MLNGRSGRGRIIGGKEKTYNHNIVDLFAAVQPLAPELIPINLEKPEGHYPPHWSDETTELFVARLYDMGNENNRYQLSGYIRRQEDLFKLDQVIFSVRRLCQPLETHFLGANLEGVPDQTVRDRMLIDHPLSSNLHSTLEKVLASGRGKFLRHIALNWNLPFASIGYRHTQMSYGMSSVNPVLVRRILEPLESGDAQQELESDMLWTWVQENIFITKEYVRAYDAERQRRKNRARRIP